LPDHTTKLLTAVKDNLIKKETVVTGLTMIITYFQNIQKVCFVFFSFVSLSMICCFCFLSYSNFIIFQNPNEIKYQKVNFLNDKFHSQVMLSFGDESNTLTMFHPALFYLTLGPAAFTLVKSPEKKVSVTDPDWFLVSRFSELLTKNEQLHTFYSKKFLLQSLEKYISLLQYIVDLIKAM
jgi:hypothetical protein